MIIRDGVDEQAREAAALMSLRDDELHDADLVARQVVEDVGGDRAVDRCRQQSSLRGSLLERRVWEEADGGLGRTPESDHLDQGLGILGRCDQLDRGWVVGLSDHDRCTIGSVGEASRPTHAITAVSA